MKFQTFPILIYLASVFSGCSQSEGSVNGSSFLKGEGDLFYRMVVDKEGPQVAEVAFVSVSYTERTEQGTQISETGILDPRPSLIFARMPEFRGDFQDALQYLSEGDSAVIKISIDSLKKHKGLVLSLSDSSKYMIFNVRINKVINKRGPADTLYPQRIEEFQAQLGSHHQTLENEKISRFLGQSSESFRQTPSGMFVSGLNDIKPPGYSGEVQVNYAFYTLDGKIMDTNKRDLAASSGIFSPGDVYEPLLISSVKAPISAFREAAALVSPGEKARLVIPSKLAFGNYGNSKNIPDFMPLVCHFEVLR